MRKIAIVLAGVLLVAAGVLGVRAYFQTSPVAKTLVIAQVADFFLYAPLYVAQDAGFFAREGLDVRIVSTGGDEKAWAAVVTGSAQFGVGDPTFVAISDQRGQPGRVVASLVNGVPFWGITLKADVPTISDPAQLKPYSVATFPSPSTAFALQSEMFKRGGLPPNIRQGAFGALIPMLKAGQADIALELEPNVSTAIMTQDARIVYSMASLYGDFAITGLTTTPTYLQANPGDTQRVVCALAGALEYIHSRPADTLDLLKKRFPELAPNIAKRALERVSAERIIPRSPAVGEAAWNKAVQLRVQLGELTDAKRFSSYVDNSFANNTKNSCRTN